MNRLFVIRPPAVGAIALLIGDLETVVAELTYLVPARTGSEVLVGEIKFFDAKGALGAVSVG